ncbi:DUF4998 domain-containing protein [Sphingobacterium arenae]|uniref:DUF5000 domain-containing protein n=1 Tax=Sphingobacterium arenae TaxID=1280598 RepID=A0ABR7Y6B1_9SPHI|nr:DUF4998 domain-containing protein [Sphingobacterium arenae]MBD1426845.1 hypothetical protein [Sphingobacterium arenae]
MKIIMKCVVAYMCISCLLFSCRKQDHFYKEFIEGGEIIYAGKADSVLFHPGKNRAQLSWRIKDPNITQMKVYWNSSLDSLTIDVNKTDGVDSIGIIIEDLEERFYSFDIYSINAEGGRSVKSTVEGQVYGDEYQENRFHRAIESISFFDDQAIILWFNPESNEVGSEIRYTDIDGVEATVFVPTTETSTTLDNVELGDTFDYRTWHRPDSLAIDTFYTDFKTEEILLIERELDYTRFAAHKLDNDPGDFSSSRVPFLWNGNMEGTSAGSGGWYRTATGSGIPNQVTIDMGVSAKLTRFKFWQRGTVSEHTLLYANANPKKIELWGTDNPDPNGDYANWNKLGEYEVVRPSGLSPGQPVTAEDIAAAQEGHEITISMDAPVARFIRIRAMETFENQPHFFLSNISVFGQVVSVE